jgi:undecaprenyl diphosphate synthase
MYTGGQPDPDIIVRPSGEYRLSNFLTWQSAYSEFWFSDILWPDFTEEHVNEILYDFQNRNRRFGGV